MGTVSGNMFFGLESDFSAKYHNANLPFFGLMKMLYRPLFSMARTFIRALTHPIRPVFIILILKIITPWAAPEPREASFSLKDEEMSFACAHPETAEGGMPRWRMTATRPWRWAGEEGALPPAALRAPRLLLSLDRGSLNDFMFTLYSLWNH